MKENNKNDNKIIALLFFVFFLYIIFGVVIMNNQNNNEKSIAVVLNTNRSNLPVIEKILLNKTKYSPGDEMILNIEAIKAKSINAFIENEKGYQKISLTLQENAEEVQFWTGNWIVADSIDKKRYNLKTIAYNEFGTYEKMSFWIDPNPGHDLSTDVVVDSNLDMNSYKITNVASIQSGQTVGQSIRAEDSVGYFIFPEHTTAERNSLSAQTGMMIFNTDILKVEFYNGSDWEIYR